MLDWVNAVRQNHALEHATLNLLSRRDPSVRLVGHSMPSGFVIYGDVRTEDLADATTEALARLLQGEEHLAVHPRCGTNAVVTGILVGGVAFAAGAGRPQSRLERLPLALMAATLAAIVAQPLALAVQRRVTTTSKVEAVYITSISRSEVGRMVSHSVTTGRD